MLLSYVLLLYVYIDLSLFFFLQFNYFITEMLFSLVSIFSVSPEF